MALKGFVGRILGRKSFQAIHIRTGNVASDAGIAVWSHYGAPTNGTSGTRAGESPPGSLLVDTQNTFLYINTNTQASPTWTKVGTQS